MKSVIRLALVDPSDVSRNALKTLLLGIDSVWLEAECSRYEVFKDVLQQSQPDINISVNVNAKNLTPSDYEVELHLDAKATSQDKVIFAAELIYAGTFRLENFPPQMAHPAVLIECPRLLFPFARQILAEATRNGGFPPLMLDPIDFASMYQKRLQQQTAGKA